MAFPYETVAKDLLLTTMSKDVPEFFGWNGEALEVPPEEYRSRLERVQVAMAAADLDLLIVIGAEDVRWLTGFHCIGKVNLQTLIVPRGGEPFFTARRIEVDLIHKYSWVRKAWTCPDSRAVDSVFYEVLGQSFPKDGSAFRTGLPYEKMTGRECKQFEDFANGFAGMTVVDASEVVEHVRLVKSEEERRCVQRASEMTEKAMAAGIASIKPGMLLSDLSAVCAGGMLSAGSEDPAYWPILRTTETAGHGSWEIGERIGDSGLVFLEFGASVRGHHAPQMRTAYVLGANEAVPSWVEEAEACIQKTFEVCLPMMKPGVLACDIDAAGRAIMTANKSGLLQSARLGYTVGGTATAPVGNAGWEDATFSIVGHNRAPLEEGMVFHFIPYYQKYEGPCTGSIGLSDTVVVTKEGGRRMGTYPIRIAILRADPQESPLSLKQGAKAKCAGSEMSDSEGSETTAEPHDPRTSDRSLASLISEMEHFQDYEVHVH